MADRVGGGVLGRGLGIMGHAIRQEPRVFAVAVTGSTAFGLLVVASALVIGAVVGRVVVPALDGGQVVPGSLAVACAAIVGLSLLKVCGIFGRRLGAGAMQYRLQATYRRRVTRRYLELPLAWHRRHPTGTLLSNANADVEAAWYPIAPMPFAVGTLLMLCGAVIALAAIDWTFALVGLAIFPALFGLNVVYSRLMSPRIGRAQALRADVSAIAHESFDGAMVVKSMGREREETERFEVRARELRDAMISVGRLRGLFDPLAEVLPSLGTLTVLIVGVFRLRQGAVTIDEVVSVGFMFTVLAFPVRAIGWVLTELPRSVVGWDRLQHVLTATGDMRYGVSELDTTAAASLRFRGVSYTYAAADEAGLNAADDEAALNEAALDAAPVSASGIAAPDPASDAATQPRDAAVLHDVSFEVPAGSTVALVGPTGSGKSTIAALAARLVDPSAGTVELGGMDVRRLSAAELAAAVALVPQVPFIFDDTVGGNVDLGRERVDEARLWASLHVAQADGFVGRLSDGAATTVGERGTSLSGGQRQRLTLARAVAGEPVLLVLDDATSAVDPRVEAAILAGLREQGRTVLVVAYRRASIALADEVVYLEHGRVVGRGSHRELLATVAGYANLVTAYERAEAEREREHAYDDADDPADPEGARDTVHAQDPEGAEDRGTARSAAARGVSA